MAGSAPIIQGIRPNGELYPVEKLEAHRTGARHVAVSAFLFADDQLLLQRRALGKYHSGGQWANTCCSHPAWGESAVACVHRRVREELGLDVTFEAVGEVDYAAPVGDDLVENEAVQLFAAEIDRTVVEVRPNADEVMEVRWMGVADLRRDALQRPEKYAPWLRIYLERARPLLERAA